VEIRPSILYPSDLRWQMGPMHHYYVTFWTQPTTASGGVDQAQIGWHEDMHEITNATDVVEVVEWAEQEARKRRALYTIFLRMDRGDAGVGLVWLAGLDPTVHPKHNSDTTRPAGVTPMAGGTQPYRAPTDLPPA
jgi:hypothetical protein